MKKIIYSFLIIILLSGCSANIDFDFKKDKIESNINSSFTLDEYYKSINDENDEISISDSQKESILLQDKESFSMYAFNNNIGEYKESKFEKNNNIYNIEYKYDYDYSNIKNSYYFNCFDNFEFTEDENYYNFKLTGSYNCTSDVTLRIKSDSMIDKSNSLDIENGVHKFTVYDDDNNIFFSINKNFDKKTSTSSLRVFVFVLLVIMVIITYGAYYIYKKQSY